MRILHVLRPVRSLILRCDVWVYQCRLQLLVCIWVLPSNSQFAHDYLPDLVGAILVVLARSLHKREAVHITHVRVAFGSEHIEATYLLFESNNDLPSYVFFLLCQIDWVPNFLPVLVSLHFAIQGRTLSRFGMRVIRSHSIDFDIEAISL